jgi:hypothetical protein
MSPKPDLLAAVDRDLLTAKLHLESERLRKHWKDKEENAYVKNQGNSNTNALVGMLFDVYKEELDSWAAMSKSVYEQVWVVQGRTIDAGFVESVLPQAIETAIRSRANARVYEMEMFAERTAFSGQVMEACVKEFQRATARKIFDWQQIIKLEAATLKNRSPVKNYPERKATRPDPVARAIFELLDRLPAASAVHICRFLDRRELQTPKPWCERSWMAAIKNPILRNRVSAYISKRRGRWQPRPS